MNFPDYEYVNTRRVSYGDGADEYGEAVFIPVCAKCGRYVKADESMAFNGLGEVSPEHNATCSKCGRARMLFEGYF